jgi:hypothetical protein
MLYDTPTICTQIAEQAFRRTSGARSLKFAVANIGDEFVKAYKSMNGLVDASINDGPLLKFELVPNTTVSGHVKFTVIKQPDPPPEPQVHLDDDTSPDSSSSDEEDDVEHVIPPNSPTGSQSSDTLAGAPRKKKPKRKRGRDAGGKFTKA